MAKFSQIVRRVLTRRRSEQQAAIQQPHQTKVSEATSKSNEKSYRWPEESLDKPASEGGGYYAGDPGNVLNARYLILRKLGWGQHANVWLVDDTQTGRHVAVKVLSSYATQYQNTLTHELESLRTIRVVRDAATHSGAAHVATLLDDFRISSLAGGHICLVTDALGTSLKDIKYAQGHGRFPHSLVKHVTRQLLQALDFLHTECQIVHTDIKLDNIMFSVSDMKSATTARTFGTRDVENEDYSDYPFHPHRSRPLSSFKSSTSMNLTELLHVDVYLTDFSSSVPIDGPHTDSAQPYALRAPEVILGNSWGPPIDIWNLGCLIFEMITSAWLFVPRSGDGWSAEEYHLAHMTAVSGDEWDTKLLEGGRFTPKYFYPKPDGTGFGPRLTVENAKSLEEALQAYGVLTGDEFKRCIVFLHSTLRLRPEERMLASELLNCEWLQ